MTSLFLPDSFPEGFLGFPEEVVSSNVIGDLHFPLTVLVVQKSRTATTIVKSRSVMVVA